MENKIYYLTNKGEFELKTQKLGVLLSDYVRVKFLYCGICGGDYSCFLGRRNSYPYTLGHEFVAEVLDVGKNVTDFSLKDLVVSDFNYRCGKCNYCLEKKEHLCLQNNIAKFSNRAFAQYADIHYKYLYKIAFSDNIASATLIEPLSCVIHAYDLMERIIIPQKLLIVGVGNVGMLFAFYLKIVMRIEQVYVYDLIPERAQRVIELFGCIHMDSSDSCKYDFIIDATNSISGAEFCLNISQASQRYCMMSHLYGLDTSFIYEKMCQKEIYPLFPLRNGNSGNIKQAIQIIIEYWSPLFEQTLELFSIEQIQQVFEQKPTLLSNKQILTMSCFWDV